MHIIVMFVCFSKETDLKKSFWLFLYPTVQILLFCFDVSYNNKIMYKRNSYFTRNNKNMIHKSPS